MTFNKRGWFSISLPSCIRAARVPRGTVVAQQGLASVQVCVDVPVKFSITRKLQYGDNVYITGGHPLLGSWDSRKSLKLEWGAGDVWSSEASLPFGTHEFKCVVIRADGSVEWETGINRSLQVSDDISRLEVSCSWCQTTTTAVSMSYLGTAPTRPADSIANINPNSTKGQEDDPDAVSLAASDDSEDDDDLQMMSSASAVMPGDLPLPHLVSMPSESSTLPDEQEQEAVSFDAASDDEEDDSVSDQLAPRGSADSQELALQRADIALDASHLAYRIDDSAAEMAAAAAAMAASNSYAGVDAKDDVDVLAGSDDIFGDLEQQLDQQLQQLQQLLSQEWAPQQQGQQGQQQKIQQLEAILDTLTTSASSDMPVDTYQGTSSTSKGSPAEQMPDTEDRATAAAAAAEPTSEQQDDAAQIPPAQQQEEAAGATLSKKSAPAVMVSVDADVISCVDTTELEAAEELPAAGPADDELPVELHPSPTDATAAPVAEAAAAAAGLALHAAAAMIPHPDKCATGGEDAFFIWQGHPGAIGVADGVSAWADDGIDAGEYSRVLMQYAAEAVQDSQGVVDARQVIKYAQFCTYKPGSSTMCVAMMRPGGVLQVANVGDCGVRIIRAGEVIFETSPQQHDFNLPYQLSHPRMFPDTDTADNADVYTPQVQCGDIVVMASDGLLDNMWDAELARIVGSCQQQLSAAEFGAQQLQGLADTLAAVAAEHAADGSFRSPWAAAARKQGGLLGRLFASRGGKLDDITVLVAVVR